MPLIGIEAKVNTKLARLPEDQLRKLLTQGIRTLMEMGEQKLDDRFKPRPAGVYLTVAEAGKGKASTGHYRRSIKGRAIGRAAKITDSRVVYGPWLEGVGSRNRTTRFKGYRVWRNTREWLRTLARNVAKDVAHSFVQRMQR